MPAAYGARFCTPAPSAGLRTSPVDGVNCLTHVHRERVDQSSDQRPTADPDDRRTQSGPGDPLTSSSASASCSASSKVRPSPTEYSGPKSQNVRANVPPAAQAAHHVAWIISSRFCLVYRENHPVTRGSASTASRAAAIDHTQFSTVRRTASNSSSDTQFMLPKKHRPPPENRAGLAVNDINAAEDHPLVLIPRRCPRLDCAPWWHRPLPGSRRSSPHCVNTVCSA